MNKVFKILLYVLVLNVPILFTKDADFSVTGTSLAAINDVITGASSRVVTNASARGKAAAGITPQDQEKINRAEYQSMPPFLYKILQTTDSFAIPFLIMECDKVHRDCGRFANHSKPKKIIQLPCLYHAYPGMPSNFCGYYAAYFAHCMLMSKSLVRLKERINNRRELDVYLEYWREMINKHRIESIENSDQEPKEESLEADLTSTEIVSILSHERGSDKVFVEADLGFDEFLDKCVSWINDSDAYFILKTEQDGGQWIVVWVNKIIGIVIADSMATNRTDFEKIIKLYDSIFDAVE